MTHCDVIVLLSHCKPMEIGIQQRFCKFVVNIFQNGTPVLRTIVSTALNNPLSVFCSNYNTICGHGNMNCLEVRANLYKDSLASLSGGLICNANALRELLGMRDGTHVSVLSFDETRDFIDDICLNWDFTSLHHVRGQRPISGRTYFRHICSLGVNFMQLWFFVLNRFLI